MELDIAEDSPAAFSLVEDESSEASPPAVTAAVVLPERSTGPGEATEEELLPVRVAKRRNDEKRQTRK